MKKENRKMAQQRRARERRKKERIRKLKKLLIIAIPCLAVIILITAIALSSRSSSGDSSSADTAAEDTSAADASDTGSSDTDSPSYSTDTSLTVESGDTVNIDYVGTVDGVEFEGGSTNGSGADLEIDPAPTSTALRISSLAPTPATQWTSLSPSRRTMEWMS